ncbi:MAG: hypothetical protein ABR985_15255 [Methanotrichaceae archaeon]|jgi:hypothetical protein
MTEQNRNYIKKEIGKLLSEIWRIKGLSEQEYGSGHPITKKLTSMHAIFRHYCRITRNKKVAVLFQHELSGPLLGFLITKFDIADLFISILNHLINFQDPDTKDLGQDLLGGLEFENP